MAGFATRTRFSGNTDRSAQTGHALRLKPDHPIGAGQYRRLADKLAAQGDRAAPLMVMLNMIQRQALQSATEQHFIERAFETMNMLSSFLGERAAYKEMTANGLLHKIAEGKSTKALASHVKRALIEATDLLNDIDATRMGLVLPEPQAEALETTHG